MFFATLIVSPYDLFFIILGSLLDVYLGGFFHVCRVIQYKHILYIINFLLL